MFRPSRRGARECKGMKTWQSSFPICFLKLSARPLGLVGSGAGEPSPNPKIASPPRGRRSRWRVVGRPKRTSRQVPLLGAIRNSIEWHQAPLFKPETILKECFLVRSQATGPPRESPQSAIFAQATQAWAYFCKHWWMFPLFCLKFFYLSPARSWQRGALQIAHFPALEQKAPGPLRKRLRKNNLEDQFGGAEITKKWVSRN